MTDAQVWFALVAASIVILFVAALVCATISAGRKQ